MIYYYIPDFYQHFNVNMKLLELIQNYPQIFYDDFKIGAVYGNFPNCIWNGGRKIFGYNVSKEQQQIITEAFEAYKVPIRLTMTNQLLTKEDCYDRYANYIMKSLDNKCNQIIISSPILEEYIRNNYPNYKLIKSTINFNENDNLDNYYMIVLDRNKATDLDYLKTINQKDKIEIIVNEICDINCINRKKHWEENAKSQLYYNEANEEDNFCIYNHQFIRQSFYNNPLCITRDQIKKFYEPMGFKHFKLEGRGINHKIIFDYAHYMVKPEWKEDFLYLMIDAVIADNK